MASEYPYMRTRLLLPETAVPVHEQDGGKQYDWEHHVSWTSWLRASCMNMILENIKVMNKMTKSILKRTYRSVHEHDDGEHHVHEHDHCEHHEHEHPVHEQHSWVHHRTWTTQWRASWTWWLSTSYMNILYMNKAYSEQHNSYFRSSMQITWMWTKLNDFNHYRNKRKLNFVLKSTLGRIQHKLLALRSK